MYSNNVTDDGVRQMESFCFKISIYEMTVAQDVQRYSKNTIATTRKSI